MAGKEGRDVYWSRCTKKIVRVVVTFIEIMSIENFKCFVFTFVVSRSVSHSVSLSDGQPVSPTQPVSQSVT